jgi:predicted RNase H-like nuclease
LLPCPGDCTTPVIATWARQKRTDSRSRSTRIRLIEIFDLPHRLLYKKGNVDSKRGGQVVLASLLRSLEQSNVLALKIPDSFAAYLNPQVIMQLRGSALKANEDALDSLICLYVCGLYATGASMQIFGDTVDGYVVVPTSRAVNQFY